MKRYTCMLYKEKIIGIFNSKLLTERKNEHISVTLPKCRQVLVTIRVRKIQYSIRWATKLFS